MYPVLNRDNLTIPIPMELYHKQKTFSKSSATFLKFRLRFNKFKTKYDPHRFCISEITASEDEMKF